VLRRVTAAVLAIDPPAIEAGRFRRGGLAVLIATALTAAAIGIVRDGARLGHHPWIVHPWRLVGATAIELGALAWGVFLWSLILAGFAGPQLPFGALLRAWRAATLAKYIPGAVWSVASTVEMAERIGASPIALPSSFLIQAALNLTGALTVAALFGGTAANGHVGVPLWLGVVAVIAALALVHPRVVAAAVRGGARLARRPAPAWEGSWLRGATLLLLYAVTWGIYGAAFALFLSAMGPTATLAPTVATWLALAGMNALAFAAGFVAFFAPGGVGVREAALIALLGAIVPGTRARVGIAAASRLWLVLTEIAGGALVGIARRRLVRRGTPHAPGYQPNAHPLPRPTPPRGADVLRGVDVDLLTDTRAALADITAACAAATRSIWIAQLAFDADCVAERVPNAPETPTLLETIVGASRRLTADGTPIDVRIVLNGGLLLDTSPALRRAIAALGAGPNVQLRTVKAFPQVMHAKVLVVDGVDAFLTGASFVNGYWDDARHAPAGAPDAGAGTGDRPLHDVAVRLSGSAAGALGEWYADLWRGTVPNDGDAITPLPMVAVSKHANAGTCAVQLLRTLPDDAPTRAGRTEILDAYLHAIDRARACIYLEGQYFSARPIARALRAALDARPELELIVVLNQNPDVTAYRAWQDARLAEAGLLGHPRVGVFALWSTAPSLRSPGGTELTQVFVHSKVAVIDDAWATLGTANLDGASLHSYGDDFASRIGRRVFAGYRNFDLNVALLDGVDGEAHTGVAAQLRRQLWSRHLDLAEHTLIERPDDGWLPLWRAHAAAHVADLAGGGRARSAGRVLPYVPRAHPREQLQALGIDAEAAILDLRFDPSWLEVRCSPGWIAKLFPERLRTWFRA
jgi:phosphatidylserine/phosphatidylglycerophosphate/cardiolipin synthase-like enzyme/uncharacterized membrane protein YbhN (UPF0104 family)